MPVYLAGFIEESVRIIQYILTRSRRINARSPSSSSPLGTLLAPVEQLIWLQGLSSIPDGGLPNANGPTPAVIEPVQLNPSIITFQKVKRKTARPASVVDASTRGAQQ